MNKQILSYS